jgi:general secretion pathway protein L
MTKKVIIFLFTNSGKADWVILDQNGAILQSIVDGELSQLKPADMDEVIVVIPSADVLLTQIKLPRLNRRRLQQALPYALEEQLLDDVDKLHFACGPYAADFSLPVAVIHKQRLEQWLQLLQQAAISADLLIPLTLALPYHRQQWHVAIIRGQAQVRTDLYAGFSSEPANLETLLALKWAEEAKHPEAILLYEDSPSLTLTTNTLPIKRLTSSEPFGEQLATYFLTARPPLNLLQGAYSPRMKLRLAEPNKKAWKQVGLLCALGLGLLLLSPLSSWILLRCEAHYLQNKMAALYRENVGPSFFSVADPREKLEAKLNQLLKESDRHLFLQELLEVAKTATAIRLQSIDFQQQQLRLTLTAPTVTTVDEFSAALRADTVMLQQQTTLLANNQVKATLLIERKRS